MILTFGKATKKKCSKNVLLNSILEKTDVWKGTSRSLLFKFGSQASSISITWELVRNTYSWALPQTLWIRISLPARPSGDSDWARAVSLRPTDPSCQILAKVPTNGFSLPQESIYVGPESLLLFNGTICTISMSSLMSIWFFLTQQQSLFIFGSHEIVLLLLSLEHIWLWWRKLVNFNNDHQ